MKFSKHNANLIADFILDICEDLDLKKFEVHFKMGMHHQTLRFGSRGKISITAVHKKLYTAKKCPVSKKSWAIQGFMRYVGRQKYVIEITDRRASDIHFLRTIPHELRHVNQNVYDRMLEQYNQYPINDNPYEKDAILYSDMCMDAILELQRMLK